MKKCSERDANTARCSARVTHTHTVQFSQSISQSMVYFILQSKAVLRYIYNGKKTIGETQTLRAGCSKAEPKIFDPSQTLFRGHRTAKINQLEMVTTFTCRPSVVKIDVRSFELSW